jgi:hypothetical protein
MLAAIDTPIPSSVSVHYTRHSIEMLLAAAIQTHDWPHIAAHKPQHKRIAGFAVADKRPHQREPVPSYITTGTLDSAHAHSLVCGRTMRRSA